MEVIEINSNSNAPPRHYFDKRLPKARGITPVGSSGSEVPGTLDLMNTGSSPSSFPNSVQVDTVKELEKKGAIMPKTTGRRALDPKTFLFKRAAPDGACLFNAALIGINNGRVPSRNESLQLRSEVVDWVCGAVMEKRLDVLTLLERQQNYDKYFYYENGERYFNMKMYRENMKQHTYYAGIAEALGIAAVRHVRVFIVKATRHKGSGESIEHIEYIGPGYGFQGKKVYIIYNGVNHFDCALPKAEAAQGYWVQG
jgi:hypothetical protein